MLMHFWVDASSTVLEAVRFTAIIQNHYLLLKHFSHIKYIRHRKQNTFITVPL